eukprot:15481327-Alexandrium_andersonii.AAC.1
MRRGGQPGSCALGHFLNWRSAAPAYALSREWRGNDPLNRAGRLSPVPMHVPCVCAARGAPVRAALHPGRSVLRVTPCEGA